MFCLKMKANNVQLRSGRRPARARPERDGIFWPENAPYFRDDSELTPYFWDICSKHTLL